MKRHFNLLASLLLVIAMVFTVVSCDLVEQYLPGNDQPEHTHSFVEGKCECGESDPDYVAPHVHSFVEGKCECGESDPNYVPPHVHEFVDGKCECGANDPDFVQDGCVNHVWDENSVALGKDATCTEDGHYTISCSVCGYTRKYDVIDAYGHEPVDVLGYEATCLEAGLTNGSVCNVCGETLVAQEEIPAAHKAAVVPGKDSTCSETGLTAGKVCEVCGEVLLAQETVDVVGHNYIDGKCGWCGVYSPNYDGEKTYVLDVQTLTPFAQKDKADGETEIPDANGFYTIYYSAKTKVDTTKDKTWSDGYTFAEGLRLNWGGTTVIGETTKNAIKIVTDGKATVKVWWICGGDGREIGIFNENGDLVVASQTDDVFNEDGDTKGNPGAGKNGVYLSELTLDAAGTYYIGTDCSGAIKAGGNIICKVETTVYPAAAAVGGMLDVQTTDTYGFFDEYTFTAGEEGYYTFTVPAGLGFYSKAQYDAYGPAEVDFYDNVNGADVVVGLEAGASYTFYVGALSKASWVINWTFEAGEVEAPVAPECNHWWMPAMGHPDMVIPTCQTGGVMVEECWNCGEIKIEQVGPDADYHDYVTDMETYKEATCQTDGYSKQTCSVCGDVKETVFDHETYGWHDYVTDAETFKEATCLEGGYAKYTCSVCGDSYEEVTEADPAWGHQEVYSSNYNIITCSVCNKVQIGVYVDATETVNGIQFGMNYGTGALYFASFNADNSVFEMYGYTATLVDGVYTITLDNSYGYESLLTATITVKPLCGGVIVTITSAEGEALVYNVYETEHLYGEGVETAPTCGAAGYTTYTCDACGHSYKEEGAPATGEHDYDHVTTAPTCTADGYTTHTCVFCDHSYKTDETEALGHADTNADYKCDKCSTKMLPADGEALTIPQALAIAKLHASNAYTTQKYYVTGVITNVYNTTYGNMYIEDAEGNEICIYGLYDSTGKTRYDAMSYKPVVGDEVTVYTVLGMYNTTAQGKNAWLDEVVAHDHDYVANVTAPTCTKAGFTTHTCSICNGYYTDSEVEALGHTTEEGECERCGLTIGGDVVNNETFKADFDTVTSTNSSYVSSTTKSGWKATNAAVMGGGTSDSNPKFKVFGDASTRAFTLNGKTSAKGKLVSPTIADGLSKLTFNYTNCFSESNGVDITITVYQNGTAVATKRLDNNSVTKLTAYTFEWDLAAEGVAVTGSFTIEITNNSPTNSTSNKDRVSIWNLEWTTNK